jgi:membrane protein YqaA with SNARE-associated domain
VREGWSPLRGVYAWVLGHAEGPYAWAIMAAIAFAESSFLPLPPDLMLVPMALAHRNRAFHLAAWCTFWSVLGGLLGYAIGSLLYNSVGMWLIQAYGMGSDVNTFRTCYNHYGALIMLQGLTPIPYKLVTIASGFAGMNLALFMLFSTITRGARFFAEATLLYFLGERVKALLERFLEIALIVFFALVIGGVFLARYVFNSSVC